MITTTRTIHLAILTAICALCFFWRLGQPGIFDQNEGLYTQAAREIALTGDWVTPHRNGAPWFDKPPLVLWMAVATFKFMGFTPLAARLPVAISTTLLVLLTYWFGRRYFSEKAGLIAGAILALNPLVVGTERQMTMDLVQSLWFACALACFFLGYTGKRPTRAWWYMGFWASCGIAFMAKSAPGLFPIPVVLAFIVWNERLRPVSILKRIWEAMPMVGVPLMLAIIAPWHILAYQANGQRFIQDYFLLHHVKLLNGTDFNHGAPWYQYFMLLLGGFFPWSVFIPWSLRGAKGDGVTEERIVAQRFVICWTVVIFVLFSAMTSKLISYLLPMYAGAALLVGDKLARSLEDRKGSAIAIHTTAIAALAVTALAAGLFTLHQLNVTHKIERIHKDAPPEVITFAVCALVLLAVGTTLSAIIGLRGKRQLCIAALATTFAGFVLLTTEQGLPAFDASINRPLQSLARLAGTKTADGTPLAVHIGRPTRPSALFYLPDRLFARKLGSAQYFVLERSEKEPIDAFLTQNRPAYVLTDNERAADLMATNAGLFEERREGRLVLLRAEVIPPPPVPIPAVSAPTVAPSISP